MKQQGLGSYWIKTDDGGMYMRNHKQIDKLPPEAKEQKMGRYLVQLPSQRSLISVIPT